MATPLVPQILESGSPGAAYGRPAAYNFREDGNPPAYSTWPRFPTPAFGRNPEFCAPSYRCYVSIAALFAVSAAGIART